MYYKFNLQGTVKLSKIRTLNNSTMLANSAFPELIVRVTSPIFSKFSLFSAQISRFSADFHRKLLDIVIQHPSNAEIWADSMF